MTKKGTYLRMSMETVRAIRMYGGEKQTRTGENVTDDQAVRLLFEEFRPDILRRVHEVAPESVEEGQKQKRKVQH